ncbi:hypothetical protein LL946_03635 [Knoellia locipacati]|uniref:hypothetical protein n=1 Tax=Knoellia locipacati TaxID=882824 RepID=UPI00384D57A2
MTRRRRRASSAPKRVGSEEGLTSSRPAPESGVEPEAQPSAERSAHGADAGQADAADAEAGEAEVRERATPESEARKPEVSGRHTAPKMEQTKDDTDEGWGEPGDDDAAARWLRENRPPHWS